MNSIFDRIQIISDWMHSFASQAYPHDIGGPVLCVTAIDEIKELIQV